MICDVEILSSLLVLSSDITERAANIDHFDIVERVEMGQMASMFFNKGKSSCIIMKSSVKTFSFIRLLNRPEKMASEGQVLLECSVTTNKVIGS